MLNFSSSPFRAAVRTLLAILLLAGGLPAVAQAPAWQSAQTLAVATAAATTNGSYVTATAVDATGNVYLAGGFRNSAVLGGTTLTSLGGNDVFVAKFNPANNQFVWAQRAGGTSDEGASALTVSGTSVYVTGTFEGRTVGFGSTTLTNAGASAGTHDVFVTKLTDTGSFVWAQQAGGTGDDTAFALTVSSTSVYVAGMFSGPTTNFGATTLTNAGTGANVGYGDVFVAKLSDTGSTGSIVWAQRAGGTGHDRANRLVVSGNSVYVVGDFSSNTADFGATTLTNITNAATEDVFVAKLTDSGNMGSFAWAQRAGGPSYDHAGALAVSGTSVYIAGNFASLTTNFGATTLTSAGGSDVFVAKLTDAGSTGNFMWAQRAGGTGGDYASALAVSGTSVYLTGGFASPTADFGATTLTSAGGSDIFLAKLTDAGSTSSFVWAQQAGGTNDVGAAALAVNGTSVYVAGYFSGNTASFGPIILANSSPGSPLGFLASLTDLTLTATTPPRAAPLQLYPNPAHRTATLRLPAGITSAPLTLCDALGRSVRRYPAPAGAEAALDLGGLPAGLYLLRGAGLAQRLVVE